MAKSAQRIIVLTGADHLEQAKSVIAGLSHDYIVGEYGNGVNEAASASYAYDYMRESGLFTVKDCNDVRLAIVDTVCTPTTGSIGQNPETKLGKVLADADVAYFGMPTDEMWPITQDYFAEKQPNVSVISRDFGVFSSRFARILRGHRFHLPQTRLAYPHRLQNADYADNVSRTLSAA